MAYVATLQKLFKPAPTTGNFLTRNSMIAGLAVALFATGLTTSIAQSPGLQPGEAFLTRFSGTVTQGGPTLIDPNGTVGAIIDLRNPGQMSSGGYWADAPRRAAITAADVGQVFGIAIDDADQPNIYVTATSAFGLHRNADNSDWMPGQWGPTGGPGSVYILRPANNYTPEPFADITLNGRANSGAALGNIAYDKANKQLFVSDLETGTIHRVNASDGSELGTYDHGMTGRANFFDAGSASSLSLPTVAFNQNTAAMVANCPFGTFAQTPSCWNFADFRRRVWGLAVRYDQSSGETRLFYAIWGSQSFGNPLWITSGEEQRNSVWSVKIAADGSFDTTDIRREFMAMEFFVEDAERNSHGPSHPIADMAFASTGNQDKLIIAERGGVRNLGLDAQLSFAHPHQSRAMLYRLTGDNTWQPDGHYDIGHEKRSDPPPIRANASGGVSFGYGYTDGGAIDPGQSNSLVWMTGSGLCVSQGACADIANGVPDSIQGHGAQGTPVDGLAENLPQAPQPGSGLARSVAIDAGVFSDMSANDASKVGDIEVYIGKADAADTETPYAQDGTPIDPDAPPPWPGSSTPAAPAPPAGPAGPVIVVTKTGPAQCSVGGICSYVVSISNQGSAAYIGDLQVLDPPPISGTGALLSYGTNPPWTCTHNPGGPITCENRNVVLQPGAAINLTLDIQWGMAAGAQPPADAVNCAAANRLVGNQAVEFLGEGCANTKLGTGQAPPGNILPPAPLPVTPSNQLSDLKIKKDIIGNILACKPNAICRFEITITNNGPAPYHQPVIFEDAMPVGWKFSQQTGGGWQKCTVTGRIIRCETLQTLLTNPPIVTLPVNGSIKIGLELMVPPAKGTPQNVWNCAKVFPHKNAKDKTGSNDKSCIQIEIPADPALQPGVDLRIFKTGPASCKSGFFCKYKIMVINYGNTPFKGPLRIVESNLTGVTYRLHNPKPQWKCKDLGNGKIQCDYGNVTLGYLQFPLPLELEVIWPSLPKAVKAMKDCAEIQWLGPWAGKGDLNKANDKACVTTPVDHSPNTVTGTWVSSTGIITIVGGGTPNCTPPSKCSYYEFIATMQDRGQTRAYDGPLNFKVNLPPGSDFPSARMTRLGAMCPASGWSCSKAGNGFSCSSKSCKLNPGDQFGVRLDGLVVPGMKVPPRTEQKKTACGIVSWRVPQSSDGIEQLSSRTETAKACHSIRILARKIKAVQPCPRGQIRKGGSCVWPPCRTGYRRNSAGKCIAKPCRRGQVRKGGKCVWKPCRRGQVRQGANCVWKPCPRGQVRQGARCVWQPCPRGQVRQGANCVWQPCPRGQVRQGARCVWQPCPRGQVRQGANCVWQPCPRGQVRQGARCVWQPCPRGQVRQGARCVWQPCPRGQVRQGARCVWQPCPRGQTRQGARCVTPPRAPLKMLEGPVKILCPPGQVVYRGRCVKPVQ